MALCYGALGNQSTKYVMSLVVTAAEFSSNVILQRYLYVLTEHGTMSGINA